MSEAKRVRWRLRLKAPPERVWWFLTTDAGRERFWAEKSRQEASRFRLVFPNGESSDCQVLRSVANARYELLYFKALTAFTLAVEGRGTTLTLESRPCDEQFEDVCAGWVSVLLALKAACDFGVDVRNHDSEHTWDEGFVDN